MKKKALLIIALLAFIYTKSHSSPADTAKYVQPYEVGFNIGLGFGIDYGGMGLRASLFPIKYVGVFGCVGYNFVGLGYNTGLIIRTLPNKRVCPYFTAMYGYNAVIYVKGAAKYNNIYYGPSASFGLEFRSKKQNYFNLEILVPFRSDAFNTAYDKMKNDPAIKITSAPLPIAISIGYHINFVKPAVPVKKLPDNDYY